MKRSEINGLLRAAEACFQSHGWVLPPEPRWDVTDFGLGEWRRHGLVLVNLSTEPEYCEKLMYSQQGMVCPNHCHPRKKEDLICRWGELVIRIWPKRPDISEGERFEVKVNGAWRAVTAGEELRLRAGDRVTVQPRTNHDFWPVSAECIMGEVSTANDDQNDNVFVNPDVGRYPQVIEDEPAYARLVGDRP